MSNYFIKSCIF